MLRRVEGENNLVKFLWTSAWTMSFSVCEHARAKRTSFIQIVKKH